MGGTTKYGPLLAAYVLVMLICESSAHFRGFSWNKGQGNSNWDKGSSWDKGNDWFKGNSGEKGNSYGDEGSGSFWDKNKGDSFWNKGHNNGWDKDNSFWNKGNDKGWDKGSSFWNKGNDKGWDKGGSFWNKEGGSNWDKSKGDSFWNKGYDKGGSTWNKGFDHTSDKSKTLLSGKLNPMVNPIKLKPGIGFGQPDDTTATAWYEYSTSTTTRPEEPFPHPHHTTPKQTDYPFPIYDETSPTPPTLPPTTPAKRPKVPPTTTPKRIIDPYTNEDIPTSPPLPPTATLELIKDPYANDGTTPTLSPTTTPKRIDDLYVDEDKIPTPPPYEPTRRPKPVDNPYEEDIDPKTEKERSLDDNPSKGDKDNKEANDENTAPPMFGPTMKPPYKKGRTCKPPTPKCCVPGELKVNLAKGKGIKPKEGKVDGVSVTVTKTKGKDGRKACSNTALIQATFEKIDSAGCFGCLESPYCGRRMLKIELELAWSTRKGWLFNVGDSESNDGYRGDNGHQQNNAELQGLYPNITIYPRDCHTCGTIDSFMHVIDGIRSSVRVVTIYVSNNHIRVNNDDGLDFNLCNHCLFALNGQADYGSGGENESVFIGINRVVKDLTRTGYGVCAATVSWACPWCEG